MKHMRDGRVPQSGNALTQKMGTYGAEDFEGVPHRERRPRNESSVGRPGVTHSDSISHARQREYVREPILLNNNREIIEAVAVVSEETTCLEHGACR